MSGLSLKYILKRGIKKMAGDPVRNICAVLLCAACAILFVYSSLFFLYDPFAVQAKFVMDLNESDYKYTRFLDKENSHSANTEVADYVAERYKSLKYVNIPSGDFWLNMNYSYNCFSYDFYITNSYEDILSFGYTFYGDYEKTLSEDSVYIFDIALKDCEYYTYENGKWESQDYSESTDTSEEWFSSFVGKRIYLLDYEGAKIDIAGVVNTGAYEISVRDIGLVGEDEDGNDLKERRNNSLLQNQRYAIGYGVFCTEEFVRKFAVNGGSLLIGGRNVNSSTYEEDKHDVSFTLTCGTSAYRGDDKNITVSNTARVYNSHNRLYSVGYKDDEGSHSYYLREATEENDGFTVSKNKVVSDKDICDEDEIIISETLYQKLFDEKYNYVNSLPAHIGEKITVNITVDGKTYEIKDKTFVGVYSDTLIYYDDAQFGIICPCEEVNRLISDYSTFNYSAVVDISGLSEGELASLFRNLDDYGARATSLNYLCAREELKNIGNAKYLYLVISAVLFVMSLLFGAWNVLHAVKRDYREIGILRANGVTAKDMSIIYIVQFIITGALSFIISLIGVNILIAAYVPIDIYTRNFMAAFPEMQLYWVGARQVLFLLAICLIVPLLVSIFAFLRIRKISPVEAINEAKKNE